ncbi:MAG: ABC transporter transmembrane domain-containing protein, partial [Promethearchaeota archaeon]
MSPKSLKEELQIMESQGSLKRTTTPGCPYDVSEDTAKKFIRLKQGTDFMSRLILQAEMDILGDKFFGKTAKKVSTNKVDVFLKVFKPKDPSRELFNYFLFKVGEKKKETIDKAFFSRYEKLEGKKEKLAGKFQEISFREEFYFEKITHQIVKRYKKTIKPYEYQVLNLIYNFQNELRLFNWNVVDKDVQVEFLFNIFKLLQIKQNLLERENLNILELPGGRGAEGLESSVENPDPHAYEILYIVERLNVVARKLKSLEKEIFNIGMDTVIKALKRRDTIKEGQLITRYMNLLYSLNDTINRFNNFKEKFKNDTENGIKSPIIISIIKNIEERIEPMFIHDKNSLDERYRNEFILVGFIIKLFRKIFTLLRKKRTMTDMYVIKRLISEIAKRDKKSMALLMILVAVNATIGMVMPLILGDLTSYIDQSSIDLNRIYNYGYTFLTIAVFTLFLSIGSNWIVQYLGNRVMYEMRARMFENLQNLSFDYYNSQPSGKIISYITNDVETIQELISSGFLTIVIDVVRLIGAVFLMFYISWQLSLTSFLIIPFILILGFFIFKKARRFFVIMRKKIAGVTTHLQESIAGMRVIKAYAIEEKDYSTFERSTKEELEINLKAAKLFSALPGLITMVISFGIGL